MVQISGAVVYRNVEINKFSQYLSFLGREHECDYWKIKYKWLEIENFKQEKYKGKKYLRI